jgi:hypothetical protein
MSLERVEQARRNAVMARRRVDSTIGALQHRLRPGNLAGEAWDGVKDKSADLADGALSAARKRPAMVSAAIGALALFLAREPLKRAVSRFVSDGEDEEDGLITTRIETDDAQFNVSAPAAGAALTEGVS